MLNAYDPKETNEKYSISQGFLVDSFRAGLATLRTTLAARVVIKRTGVALNFFIPSRGMMRQITNQQLAFLVKWRVLDN